MGELKRATVYLEPKLHKALKLKALETETSISDLVNEAVMASLAENADDLEAFEERHSESSVDFETFLKQLRKNGEL